MTIVGGGVAALEAMIALRGLAEERVAIELVSPTPEWSYRPLAVAEPFGLGEATRYDLVRIARAHGASCTLPVSRRSSPSAERCCTGTAARSTTSSCWWPSAPSRTVRSPAP